MKTHSQVLLASIVTFGGLLSSAQAETWTRFEKTSPLARQLVKSIKTNGVEEALLTYSNKASTTAVGRSENGRALYSYMLATNGMPLEALESLYSLKNSQGIHPELLANLREVLPLAHPVWSYARIPNKAFLYSKASFSLVEKFWGSGITTATEYGKAASFYKTLQISEEKAPWAFLLALYAIEHDLNEDAHKYLNEIEKMSNYGGLPKDRVALARARFAYQKKQFNSAIENYKKIDQGSDYWFESLEEQGWSYLQLKQPQRSLGVLKTVTADVFKPVVGPESYFLNAYILMKLCDYKEVFKFLDRFKKAYKERAVLMEKISSQGSTKETREALQEIFTKGLSFKAVAAKLEVLPRLVNRDGELQALIGEAGQRKNEMIRLDALLEKADSQSSLKTALLESKSRMSRRAGGLVEAASLGQAEKRVRALAQEELKEISQILQKMQLVEAESIQRLYSYQQLQANFKGDYKDTLKKQGDVMVFEADEEVWLDELDKYQVEVKGCPTESEVSK